MFKLVKRLQEIQRVKRKGMLMTEAAQNELRKNSDDDEDDDEFSHSQAGILDLDSMRGKAVSDSGLGKNTTTMDH